MSVCTFLASNYILPEIEYFLYPFTDIQDIQELASAEIFNHPDKYIPSRPSFYCLKITR